MKKIMRDFSELELLELTSFQKFKNSKEVKLYYLRNQSKIEQLVDDICNSAIDTIDYKFTMEDIDLDDFEEITPYRSSIFVDTICEYIKEKEI